MTNYGVIYGKVAPPTIQMTDSMVFVADEIQPFTQQYEGKEITGFKYNYKSYTKDEYILLLAQRSKELEEELAATKIILGVN